MQRYYVLLEDTRIPYKIQPSSLPRNTSFEDFPPVQVLDMTVPIHGEFSDWLSVPTTLLSNAMKRILAKYNVQARFKRVYLIDRKDNQSALYWMPYAPAMDVLSPRAEFDLQGQYIKRLVLDREKVQGQHFFTIQGIREPYFIISIEAAESLLRRNLSGFRLQSVELA
ncbi:MAG: imm11 family protein [Bacillota bacterium]|uniref:imm11 family protein n=1 Tax=Paenibacillus maysiensis TaxID=1155954 RepID=UPI00046EF9ED|nr:hypothetical protein [Paenibacillus maysiensis]